VSDGTQGGYNRSFWVTLQQARHLVALASPPVKRIINKFIEQLIELKLDAGYLH
jgi:hypothetical protein